MRSNSDNLLGPNHGQISTYTLFVILWGRMEELQYAQGDLSMYENCARELVMKHLEMVPRVLRTPDPLSVGHNLTGRTYLAPEIGRVLRGIPKL